MQNTFGDFDGRIDALQLNRKQFSALSCDQAPHRILQLCVDDFGGRTLHIEHEFCSGLQGRNLDRVGNEYALFPLEKLAAILVVTIGR